MNKLILSAAVIFSLCLFSSSVLSQTTQTYTVLNSSGMTITGVSLSPNDANTWGLDLNTTGNVMMDKSFEFTQPLDRTNCVYDVRYMDESGRYYYVQDVDLCSSTSITLPNPAQDDRGKMNK